MMGGSEQGVGPRREPDTDSHGMAILGPSSPDRTGYPELDRERVRWRWAMLASWVVGLLTATAAAAVFMWWPLIIVGLGIVLGGTILTAFGNATVSERARIRREDEVGGR